VLNRAGNNKLGGLTQRGVVAASKGSAGRQMNSDLMVHNIDRETYNAIAHEFSSRRDIEYINMKFLENK
jgi:hypothetical protein